MKWSYRCEFVKCGKERCSCRTSGGHGPYWYAYAKVAGKLTKRYIGKRGCGPGTPGFDPLDGQEQPRPEPPPINFPAWWRQILSSATASCLLAYDIIGVPNGTPKDATQAAYRARIKATHPDRGGDEREAACVLAAYAWLKDTYGW